MAMLRIRMLTGLVFSTLAAACLPAFCLAGSQSAPPEACIGSASLEAQIKIHPTADAYAELGDWFSQAHRSNCAVHAFQSALAIDSGCGKALDGLARALIDAGDAQGAIRLLRNAHRDEITSVDLAVAYRKAQMFDEAAEVLREALKSYPSSDSVTGALVSLEAHQSHYAAAQTLAEELARQKPDDIEAQRIYFRTLVVIGDNDAAMPLGRKLLALAPKDEDLLNLNGFLERKAGDFAAARKHLEEAVALNPNDMNPRVNLGLVLAQLHDPAAAKVQLEKAVELGATEPQVRAELAKVLRALGENDEAQRQLKLYQQKLKEDDDQEQAVLKATEAAQAAKEGDNRKAADLYREATVLEPQDAGLAYRLAVALGDLGDAPGQRAALEQAIKADPNFALAQYDLGYMDFRSGDNSAAEQHFRVVVKSAPDNAQAWLSLAATLATEGQTREAQDAAAHALKIDPNNAGALDLSRKLAAAQARQ
ncbi:MAG: tetratricopeptide repeat protein [Terracidiphilus sp.]|jgi:Flp pilus assembly protein TadD